MLLHLLKYLCTYHTVSFIWQLGEPPFEKCCFHKWVCPLRGKRVQKKCTTYHPFDRGGGGLKLFGPCPYGHISKRGFTYRRIAFIPHVSRCGIHPCYQLCLPNSASRNSFLMVPVLWRGDKSRGAPTWGQSLTPETRIGKYLTTPTMQMADCKYFLFNTFPLLFHFYLTAPKYLNHNYLMLRVFFHSVVSKYFLEFCTKKKHPQNKN